MEDKLKQIVEPLLQWYDGHARILPWRENPTPYRVWVSEIMLQQTRVEAVKPYFERFMKKLPELEDLAKAGEETLLKLWEGLGYYNRVRNMQKAALTVMEKYDGKIPADYEALLTLSGIGHYTAGAVASIAYGIPVPAVDGNVLRVIMRITADDSDIMKQSVKNTLEGKLLKIMPQNRAGDFNQALMELGATVCVPNGMAKCAECPLCHLCEAEKKEIVMELPKKTPKKPRKLENKTVLVIMDGNKAIIRKRPSKGLLAGLYEFPSLKGHAAAEEVLEYVKELGLSPIRIQRIGDSKHIFSHIEWNMIGYVVRVEELEDIKGKKFIFIEPSDTKNRYPIPTAFKAYSNYFKE